MIFIKVLGVGGCDEYWPMDYVVGVEWSEVCARDNPEKCPVVDRETDGTIVGPCGFIIKYGVECPRHGTVIQAKK